MTPPHASKTITDRPVCFCAHKFERLIVMALLNTKTADTAQELLDYKVIDQSSADIGSVHSFWADPQTGDLQFLGVKTGWLFGQNHVIPVDRVEFDDANRNVRVPYTVDFIKGALSIDADSEISDEQEQEIYRYYQVGGRSASTTTTGTDYAATDKTTTRSMATDVAAAGAAASLTNTGTTASTTRATTSNQDTVEVPLTEEEIKVGKRTVDAGQVRLRKVVRTEVVNQPVEIRHEDVVVERIAAGDVRSGTATSDFKEETIDVPLSREEVVVSKEAHITGAVRLHKTSEAEQQNVSETIRKEDVEVLRDGKTVTERDAQK